MGDLSEVSDDALLECVDSHSRARRDSNESCSIRLLKSDLRLNNVAERLFTGRRAENLFLGELRIVDGNSATRRYSIVAIPPSVSICCRRAARTGIEVKGLKGPLRCNSVHGPRMVRSESPRTRLLACCGRKCQWTPIFGLWRDPQRVLRAQCRYQRSVAALWTSRVALRNVTTW